MKWFKMTIEKSATQVTIIINVKFTIYMFWKQQ